MPTKRTARPRTASRPPDAIALLTRDHKTIKTLLKKLNQTNARGSRSSLLNQIEKELRIHTRIEEEIFYPEFKNAARPDQKKLYFESLEEHHVVDLVLPEIKAEEAGSPEFAAKTKVLLDLVEHHAKEEETQMFSIARRVMRMQQLKDLGMELLERKKQLSTGIWERAMEVLNPFVGKTNKTVSRRTTRKSAA